MFVWSVMSLLPQQTPSVRFRYQPWVHPQMDWVKGGRWWVVLPHVWLPAHTHQNTPITPRCGSCRSLLVTDLYPYFFFSYINNSYCNSSTAGLLSYEDNSEHCMKNRYSLWPNNKMTIPECIGWVKRNVDYKCCVNAMTQLLDDNLFSSGSELCISMVHY